MDLPKLQPGDHLLYWCRCAIDYVICLKTWSDVAHIEVFANDERSGYRRLSMASRAEGVNIYPFRSEGLRYVLRPRQWDDEKAASWFINKASGQKYDWLGLLCFTLAVKRGSPDRMFCSEFARELDRAAGCPSFAENWPGDKTAPGSFLMSPAFDIIYRWK